MALEQWFWSFGKARQLKKYLQRVINNKTMKNKKIKLSENPTTNDKLLYLRAQSQSMRDSALKEIAEILKCNADSEIKISAIDRVITAYSFNSNNILHEAYPT
jgi:hypothetical protein